jgi:hypothetical protein
MLPHPKDDTPSTTESLMAVPSTLISVSILTMAQRSKTLFCVVTVATFPALLFAYGVTVRRRASTLLAEVKGLSRATDPTSQFQTLKRKYRDRFKPSDPCTPEHCYYEIVVNNRALAMLGLVPYTELKVYFQLNHGSLTRTLVEYRAALHNGTSPVVHVQDDLVDGVEFYMNPNDSAGQAVSNGLITIGRSTTEDQRNRAFSLNLACLTKVGGCKDGRNLLPGIW